MAKLAGFHWNLENLKAFRWKLLLCSGNKWQPSCRILWLLLCSHLPFPPSGHHTVNLSPLFLWHPKLLIFLYLANCSWDYIQLFTLPPLFQCLSYYNYLAYFFYILAYFQSFLTFTTECKVLWDRNLVFVVCTVQWAHSRYSINVFWKIIMTCFPDLLSSRSPFSQCPQVGHYPSKNMAPFGGPYERNDFGPWQRFTPWSNSILAPLNPLLNQALTFGLPCSSLLSLVLARTLLCQFSDNPPSLISEQIPYPPHTQYLTTLACL